MWLPEGPHWNPPEHSIQRSHRSPRKCPDRYIVATMTSPRTKNATAEGTTKKEIFLSPFSSRCRSTNPISSCVPNALDMAGNSAAEIAMPNKLTGNEFKVCAYPRAETAPVGRKLASTESTYALICTTPRLTNTGRKFRVTVFTCSVRSVSFPLSGRRNPITVGNCTANCRPLPMTDAIARTIANRGSVTCPPFQSKAVIWATFQITGAA